MTRCPTCGKDTSGSEGWSTGQCDDCYLASHVTCEWFLLCDHESIGVTWHPILGFTPVCKRCADKLDLTVYKWEESK